MSQFRRPTDQDMETRRLDTPDRATRRIPDTRDQNMETRRMETLPPDTTGETTRQTRRSGPHINSEYRKGNPKAFLTVKYLYLALSALMIVFLGKIVFVDGGEIRINAYNPRLTKAESQYVRGAIYDAQMEALAYTDENEEGEKIRIYPYGEIFAHITGYSLRTKTGLELKLNDKLLSSDHLKDQLKYLFGGGEIYGNSAVLTIDGDLQRYAYELMSGYRGAVVISEPSTGKILALVSTPSFDPNTVSANWDELSAREDSPMYARATQGQYPPGSTFKIITALGALRTRDLRDFVYECTGSTPLGSSTLPCFGGEAHGTEDIRDAFANSCNTYFSNLGLMLGANVLRQTADSLYLNQKIDFILPQSMSKVVVSEEDGPQMIGETAIGQGRTQVTPFSMNMIACAIANGGMLYKPYLVDRMIDKNDETVEKTLPELYNDHLLTEEEAVVMEDLMEGVISRGTAQSLGYFPCMVYGKTGTAQVADGDSVEPHSWFTGYTKVDGKPDIAITVLVENGAESYPAVPVVYQLLSYLYY